MKQQLEVFMWTGVIIGCLLILIGAVIVFELPDGLKNILSLAGLVTGLVALGALFGIHTKGGPNGTA